MLAQENVNQPNDVLAHLITLYHYPFFPPLQRHGRLHEPEPASRAGDAQKAAQYVFPLKRSNDACIQPPSEGLSSSTLSLHGTGRRDSLGTRLTYIQSTSRREAIPN